MKKFNTDDQWSDSEKYIRSKKGQHNIACDFVKWQWEEDLSDDGLLDEVIDEICQCNKADLFDVKKIYIDLNDQPITDDLRADTRHQVGRLLAKAQKRPKQRLQERQVRFYMWFSLAIKCREARKAGGTSDQ